MSDQLFLGTFYFEHEDFDAPPEAGMIQLAVQAGSAAEAESAFKRALLPHLRQGLRQAWSKDAAMTRCWKVWVEPLSVGGSPVTVGLTAVQSPERVRTSRLEGTPQMAQQVGWDSSCLADEAVFVEGEEGEEEWE